MALTQNSSLFIGDINVGRKLTMEINTANLKPSKDHAWIVYDLISGDVFETDYRYDASEWINEKKAIYGKKATSAYIETGVYVITER